MGWPDNERAGGGSAQRAVRPTPVGSTRPRRLKSPVGCHRTPHGSRALSASRHRHRWCSSPPLSSSHEEARTARAEGALRGGLAQRGCPALAQASHKATPPPERHKPPGAGVTLGRLALGGFLPLPEPTKVSTADPLTCWSRSRIGRSVVFGSIIMHFSTTAQSSRREIKLGDSQYLLAIFGSFSITACETTPNWESIRLIA